MPAGVGYYGADDDFLSARRSRLARQAGRRGEFAGRSFGRAARGGLRLGSLARALASGREDFGVGRRGGLAFSPAGPLGMIPDAAGPPMLLGERMGPVTGPIADPRTFFPQGPSSPSLPPNPALTPFYNPYIGLGTVNPNFTGFLGGYGVY